MNVIPLTDEEIKALSIAQASVTTAQVALDKARSDYNAAFNGLLTTHNLATGPNAATLSADGKYLIA